MLDHLDHLAWLGVNTVLVQPVLRSPFTDAGYDVSDYLRVRAALRQQRRPRAAHRRGPRRGIRVLLDLVAGHTSDQHSGFGPSCRPTAPDPEGDRYIWSDRPRREALGQRTRRQPVGPPADRGAVFYLKNFYDEQPALNFGYAEPARRAVAAPVDAPGPRRQRPGAEATSWRTGWTGASPGFRVDMAFSLVK